MASQNTNSKGGQFFYLKDTPDKKPKSRNQVIAEAIDAMKGRHEELDVKAVTDVAVEKLKAGDSSGKNKICRSAVEKTVREAIAQVKKNSPLVKGFESDDGAAVRGNKLSKRLGRI